MTNRVRNFVIGIIFVTLCALSLTSCQTWDNHGFPSTVSFKAEGGRQTFKGDGEWFYGFEIKNSKGDVLAYECNMDNDSIIISYEWLTIKTKVYSTQAEFIATPNTRKKNRSFVVIGSFGKDNAYIKVKQKH